MTKGIFYIHHAIINEIFVVGLKGLDISEVGSSTVQFAPASKIPYLYITEFQLSTLHIFPGY